MTLNLRMAVLAGGLAALAGPLVGEGRAHAQTSAPPSVLMVHDADPGDLARVNGEVVPLADERISRVFARAQRKGTGE